MLLNLSKRYLIAGVELELLQNADQDISILPKMRVSGKKLSMIIIFCY